MTALWLWRSLASRLVLLSVVFLAVPALIYDQFRRVDEGSQAILLQSAGEQGIVTARALEPELARADVGGLHRLTPLLARLADERTRLRLLIKPRAPASEGFFYVAAAPPVSTADLDHERRLLLEQGVLDRLAMSCDGDVPLALRVVRPAGGEEVLTSITPVNTPLGCWALVTSHDTEAYLGSSLGRPYWRTAGVQAAALIYLVMAALVLAVLLGVWRNLRRFGELARMIGNGEGEGRFAERNKVPELAGVAEDFDRLVETLRHSAISLREAAEDNAHAFKTPIAIIRQATEPLRRVLAGADVRCQRALAMIERSLDRLDGLVSFARRMDEASADLLEPPRRRVDLSELVGRMARGYAGVLSERRVHMRASIDAAIIVRASEDILETVVENIVENAVSFSPPDGLLTLRLRRRAGMAELVVEDEGPGVESANLPRIFERYFSHRANEPMTSAPEAELEDEPMDQPKDEPRDESESLVGAGTDEAHFGIGLWIVRRNVEAVGGRVTAENRAEKGGLRLSVTLPLAS